MWSYNKETFHFLCRIYKLINREKSPFFSVLITCLQLTYAMPFCRNINMITIKFTSRMLKLYTRMPFNLLIGFTVRSKHDSRFFITYAATSVTQEVNYRCFLHLTTTCLNRGLPCLLCIIHDYGNSEWNLCSKTSIIKIMLFIFFAMLCIVRVRSFE